MKTERITHVLVRKSTVRNRIGINENGAVRTGHCPSSDNGVECPPARRCSVLLSNRCFRTESAGYRKTPAKRISACFFSICLLFANERAYPISFYPGPRKIRSNGPRRPRNPTFRRHRKPTTVRMFHFFFFQRSVCTFCAATVRLHWRKKPPDSVTVHVWVCYVTLRTNGTKITAVEKNLR